MNDNVIVAALAGLLHDVGKFAQRTAMRPTRLWNEEAEREYKYEHALFSGDFVERYLPRAFKPLSPPAYHHAPQSDFDRLIQRADALSAGERDPERDKHPKQLQSIFTRLSLSANAAMPKPHYHTLEALRLDKDVLFPVQTTERDDAAAYERLWGSFVQAADELKQIHERQPHLETYLESMLGLMQQYTWSIPAAYYAAVPDVSLYDHSRSTAAIAACLATRPANADSPAALLVGGDISGVQKFIYTLSSKKAAQTLRGRSFYLQLLTEAILRYVLRELSLPYTNVIYSGGGHFYLLTPISAKSELPRIQGYITETLLTHHGTALYLALGHAEIPATGFRLGELPKHWDVMHRDLNRSKQSRYRELGEAGYDNVFAPQTHGGNREALCSVCGEERLDTVSAPEPDDVEAKICGLCQSFSTDIGKQLPQAHFVALGLGKPQTRRKGGALGVLRAFGLHVFFVQDADNPIEFVDSIERAVIWALDDPQDERWPTVKGVPTARALRYTVNLVPYTRDWQEANEINRHLTAAERTNDPARPVAQKTFSHLEAQARGIARLGVLRMDVDRLGDLFKDGFGKAGNSIASLSRIAALSFQLSLFFEGWVRRLCEQYPELIYAVYAGGDDIFLIGPWDVMPGLAASIAAEFQEFAAANADVHLSGGMTFIHGKYPVYQAADDAHDALEQAKNIEDKGKNAFGFLGRAWKWDDFTIIQKNFVKLTHLVSPPADGGLGYQTAVIQVLRKLADDRKTDKRERIIWGPWMWQIAYHFTRRIKEAGKDTPVGQALDEIHLSLKDDSFRNLPQWGAAARWVQLYFRERDDGR